MRNSGVTGSQDPKKFPTFDKGAPEEFQVQDLLGQVQLNPFLSAFCKFLNLPPFDPKFFSAEYSLHEDFIPDPVKRRNFQIFIAVTVLVTSVVMILPLALIFFTVGRMFQGTMTFAELPIALVGIFLLLLPGYLYYANRIEKAWQRYASFVYSNAEPKTVRAHSAGAVKNSGIPIYLDYPNGYREVVYARFYKYNYSVLQKLFSERPVCMLRDRNLAPSAVILEIDGDRIWCASRP